MSEAQEKDLFDVSDIFSSRTLSAPLKADKPDDEEPDEPVEKGEGHQAAPLKPRKDILPFKEKDSDPEDEDDVKPEPKEKAKSNAGEIEKLQKTLRDTQRSFHEDRKKLTAYKKAVEKLKGDGSLLDEEARMLLDHTMFENVQEEPEDEPVIVRYAKVWDKEIEYMRKYSSNADDINNSIYAFQHLMQSSTENERQEILDELSEYEDDEVELTKQMIEIGRQYDEDIYSDIREAGNIRNLKKTLAKKEHDLQKQLDKLQVKYDKLRMQYEDYDANPVSIRKGTGSGSMSSHGEQGDGFDVGKIFASRNNRR